LKSLTRAAKEKKGNLLELSIAAARERATIGEISYALEKVFGRYQENLNITQGVYKKSFSDNIKIDDIKESINKFTKEKGRKPKMLVAKLGQDGHDRGAKVIASSFSDLGFDTEITKLFLTPEELIEEADKIKPDVVGISSHAAAHMTLVTDFMNLLKSNKNNYLVICGGVIPKKDINKLKNLGVSEIFGPGTNIINACYKILNLIKYGKKSNI
jgi:methylmalonyl-CoA mutase